MESPAVNLRILKDINFSSGTFLNGILGMALMSSLFIMPLFLQQLLGYPAIDSGLALIPRAIAMIMTMPIAGRLYNRLGPRPMMGWGYFKCGIFLSTIHSFFEHWFLGHIFSSISTGNRNRISFCFFKHIGTFNHRKAYVDRCFRPL